MSTRKLIVPVVADSAGFKRGLKESEKYANEFEAKIKGTTSHVRSHIFGIGAAFIGVGGLVEGLKKSVEAAVELGQSQSQLAAQFKANKENIGAYSMQIRQMNVAMERVGFTNAQSEEAFSRLDRATGNAAQAMQYMGVTADLAAAKHVSLSQAALVVGKVIDGSTSALTRYGIAIPKGTSATDALAIAQTKLAGQAKAMAKPTEVFSTILTDLEAKIGKALLPTIEKYMNKLETWIGKSENQRRITELVTSAAKGLTEVISTVVPWIERGWKAAATLNEKMGGLHNTLIVLGAAWVGYRTSLIVTAAAEVAFGAAGVGALTAIKGALISTGIGAAFVGIGLAAGYAITHWDKVKAWFGDFWGWLKNGWRIAVDEIKGIFFGWVASVIGLLKKLADGAASALGWLPGIGGKLKAAAHAIDEFYSDFRARSDAAFADIGKSNANTWADAYVGTIKGRNLGPGTGGGVNTGTHDTSGGVAPSRAPSSGKHYTESQMGGLLVAAGAPPRLAGILAHIAYLGESGGNAGAVSGVNSNGTRDYGLFQINSSHGYSTADMLNPMQNAKEALSVYHSQGFGAWTEAYGRAAVAKYGNWLPMGGVAGASTGGLPGDAASAAAAAKAQTAAEKHAAAAAKAAAAAAYKSWRENYFTPLDNQYKSDLLVTNESARLNKLEALHAKLAIDLKGATGKEHQDLLNEETKVQGKIMSLRQTMANQQKALLAKQHQAYVSSLQADLSVAQSVLQRQQTVFDRAWSRISSKLTAGLQAKFAAQTPEEQARDAFQAQLDAAQKAADLASAQNDLVAAQQSGDPQAVQAAQAHLDDVQNQQKLADLKVAADQSRAVQDAAGQTALDNLNDWLADQKTALEGGTQTWDGFWQAAFSDAPSKYAPDAVSSLQGVIDQMLVIQNLQDEINGVSTTSAGGGLVSGLGGATGFRLLNPLPHFASGGKMPGRLGQPGLAVLHGGETVTPAGGHAGVVHNHFSFPNYVGDKRELIDTVVSGLSRYGLGNPSTIRTVLGGS